MLYAAVKRFRIARHAPEVTSGARCHLHSIATVDQRKRPGGEDHVAQQADLLSILGVFAEPLIDAVSFIALVGKEKLMASDLISHLVDEKVAELEQKLAATLHVLQTAVEDAVILRFPNTPAALVRKIRSLTELEQLAALQRALLRAPDQAAAEALLSALPAAQ